MARNQRCLSAIVSADAMVYSVLIGRVGGATFLGFNAQREKVIDPKIAEHGDRIIKTQRNALLREPPGSSMLGAVRSTCMAWSSANAGVPSVRRPSTLVAERSARQE